MEEGRDERRERGEGEREGRGREGNAVEGWSNGWQHSRAIEEKGVNEPLMGSLSLLAVVRSLTEETGAGTPVENKNTKRGSKRLTSACCHSTTVNRLSVG